MSDSTFHTTQEDIRKSESKVSQKNDGDVPADSEPSLMKSVLNDKSSKSKHDVIEERRTNLPLPEDPPVASDWNSNDASKVNVGSGGIESDVSYGGGQSSGLRGAATSESGVTSDPERYQNPIQEGAGAGGDTTSGQNYASSTGGSGGSTSGSGDSAPGYVSSVTQPFNQTKVKGANITEGSAEDFKEPSNQDSEIGTDNDPGRRAEGDFQKMTQQSSGSTAPRQGGSTGEGQYGALQDDQNL